MATWQALVADAQGKPKVGFLSIAGIRKKEKEKELKDRGNFLVHKKLIRSGARVGLKQKGLA